MKECARLKHWQAQHTSTSASIINLDLRPGLMAETDTFIIARTIHRSCILFRGMNMYCCDSVRPGTQAAPESSCCRVARAGSLGAVLRGHHDTRCGQSKRGALQLDSGSGAVA